MSHPTNRRERFLIGKKLGEKRAFGQYNSSPTLQGDLEFMRRAEYLRRDTTKLCSCSMCGNPRRKAWKDKLTMQEKRFSECSTPTGGVTSMSQTNAYALWRSDGRSTDYIPSLSF
jgi:hypothetical protein